VKINKKSQTFLVFVLEFLDEVVVETVVEIFSIKMGITSNESGSGGSVDQA
jgi:hypothetical protein